MFLILYLHRKKYFLKLFYGNVFGTLNIKNSDFKALIACASFIQYNKVDYYCI